MAAIAEFDAGDTDATLHAASAHCRRHREIAPNSGGRADIPGPPLWPFRTHALQQESLLFGRFVSAAKQRERNGNSEPIHRFASSTSPVAKP